MYAESAGLRLNPAMRIPKLKLPRVTFVRALLALIIVASGLFFFIRAESSDESTLTINVMNNGRLIHAVNLGEARWSGAAYQVYSKSDRSRLIAEANSGHGVVLPHGEYVVKLIFSDGENVHEQWLEPLEFQNTDVRDVHLDVPASAFGPQQLKNSWRP